MLYTLNMKTIEFNGVKLVDFTPQDDQPKGIVHIKTIQKLAQLLPRANIDEIIKDLLGDITTSNNRLSGTALLDNVLVITEEFVTFHRTVNLIREYKPEVVQVP